MRKRRYVYDYYRIYLADCAGDFDDRELMRLAINEAREKARLYCMPCEWQAMGWDGPYVIVRRKRHCNNTRLTDYYQTEAK